MSREKAAKAYLDEEFLKSREGRIVRIMSEYLQPKMKLKDNKINHTVAFFGSARIKPDNGAPLSESYWAAENLAFMIAEWSKTLPDERKLYICTGGGPGIMEAANRGAARANEKTIGLNISLPFEQHPNPYISEELNFEFHYFYMRKLWFLYHAKALVVFPGGFGTMDEMFETLTLIQTKKIEKQNIPIYLYNSKFWNKLINFEYFVEEGLISKEDLKLFNFFDSPEEGFEKLKPEIIKITDHVNSTVFKDV
ncbi:MAG: LOG family protein [Spirochaetes bacterium]|nr:LOG family protein [Spirochaetota bacterium]